MVRIRYTKEGNLLKNKNVLFLTNGNVINVTLNTVTVQTQISNPVGEVLTVLTAHSLSTLKVNTKKYLRDLGVVFQDEIRNRGNTEIIGTEVVLNSSTNV